MLLNESKVTEVLTEGLKHHLETKTPLYENIYRPGSEEYFNTIRQARLLMNKGVLTELCFEDMELLFETEVGEYGEYNGKKVPLDFPLLLEISYEIPVLEVSDDIWDRASQIPQVMALGEEQWKKLAGLGQASGGLGYGAKYTDLKSSIQLPQDGDQITFPDDAKIQMPIVVKYSEGESVKYQLIKGGAELASLISGQIDPNPEIWVVDVTETEGSSLDEILTTIREADLTQDQKVALITKIVKMARAMGSNPDLESVARTIASQIQVNTAATKLKPGQVNVVGGTRVDEAKYQGKEVALNKPHRGGPKKFYVYTRNPKTGKIIKVNFGDTTGLSAKINNKTARVAFSKRHNCPAKKDKTKAGYWSCRLPRYASLLGLKSSFGGYW